MTRKEKTLSERSKLEDQTQNILEYLNNINHEHSIKLSAKQKPPSEDSFITFPPPKKESKESLPVDLCHKGQWDINELEKFIKPRGENEKNLFIGDDFDTFDPSKMYQPYRYKEEVSGDILKVLRNSTLSRRKVDPTVTPFQLNKLFNPKIPQYQIDRMKHLGYRILEFERFNWSYFVSALEVYKINFGHANPPFEFVIGQNIIDKNIGYNSSFLGMNLGAFTEQVRIGDIDGLEDPSRRRILDTLNFDWGDKSKYLRFRFYPLYLAMKIYFTQFGSILPSHDFIIPDNEPIWPYWMVNMPFGKWITIARIQQKLIQTHYPDRKKVFDSLNFFWWIPPPSDCPEEYYGIIE